MQGHFEDKWYQTGKKPQVLFSSSKLLVQLPEMEIVQASDPVKRAFKLDLGSIRGSSINDRQDTNAVRENDSRTIRKSATRRAASTSPISDFATHV
jgi:hypothetical protein